MTTCPSTDKPCVYGSDCSGLGFCKRRIPVRPERAPLADPVIACILAMGDVREKRGGDYPAYLSTYTWADLLTALKARGWELTPVDRETS